MNSLILAALLALNPGYNNPGVAGEVVAIEAATSNATATVGVKAVSTLTAYTNATAEVVKYESAWSVTYTNFDGEASLTTNVVGVVNYDDFQTQDGKSKIVGEPQPFEMPFTNTVVTARLPAATYAATNTIATIATSGHFGQATTNAFIFGGGILVTGAADCDSIKVIYK